MNELEPSLTKNTASEYQMCCSSSWVRTAMMKEKKGPLLDSERLLIRGAEQKFVNANISSSDLHLNL